MFFLFVKDISSFQPIHSFVCLHAWSNSSQPIQREFMWFTVVNHSKRLQALFFKAHWIIRFHGTAKPIYCYSSTLKFSFKSPSDAWINPSMDFLFTWKLNFSLLLRVVTREQTQTHIKAKRAAQFYTMQCAHIHLSTFFIFNSWLSVSLLYLFKKSIYFIIYYS